MSLLSVRSNRVAAITIASLAVGSAALLSGCEGNSASDSEREASEPAVAAMAHVPSPAVAAPAPPKQSALAFKTTGYGEPTVSAGEPSYVAGLSDFVSSVKVEDSVGAAAAHPSSQLPVADIDEPTVADPGASEPVDPEPAGDPAQPVDPGPITPDPEPVTPDPAPAPVDPVDPEPVTPAPAPEPVDPEPVTPERAPEAAPVEPAPEPERARVPEEAKERMAKK